MPPEDTSWEEEMAQASQQRQSSSSSEFYKFGVGEHVMRIMTRPVRKESRYGYGVCYPGAPYCDPAVIDAEHEKKMEAYGTEVEEARKRGATKDELKRIKKPSRANLELKWSVWAYVRTFKDEKGKVEPINELRIVDLPHGVSESLLALKTDKDMGTAFDGFPMPYDIKVTKKKKDMKGRPWTPKDVEYSLTAGQIRKDVTEEEVFELEKKQPIQQIIERMGEKAREKFEDGGESAYEDSGGGHSGVEYPQVDINPDDIPF
jgi:hypothetical protein